jgi:hypothetical protein
MLEGKPVPVDITTGISDGSYTEVTSGALKEGQEIMIRIFGPLESKFYPEFEAIK